MKKAIFETTHRSGAEGWLIWLSIAVSIALHLAGYAYLALNVDPDHGSVRTATAAISINLQQTEIVDAVEDSPAKEAQASVARAGSASPEPADGKPDDDVQAEAKNKADEEREQRDAEAERARQEAEAQRLQEERDREQRAAEQKRQAEERARREREAAEKARREREAAEKRQRERQKKADDARRRRAAEKAQKSASEASASAKKNAETRRARVSASRGDILDYAARVNAWIARNKPSARGVRGRAVVYFKLSSTGRLISARIARSSGDQRLDRAAVTAVQRSSPFPRPPKGATSAQLRFSFPVTFR